MNRIYLLLVLLGIAAVLSACSGGAGIERESAKKASECIIVSDVDKAGCPCIVRCRITGDPDFDLLRFTWTWTVNGGTLTEMSADGTVAWISIDEPGVCTLTARGVDKDGKDCTTPKHKLHCTRGVNAPPVLLPEGPFSAIDETRSDSDGSRYRYHEWRWNTGRSYDPEGDACEFSWVLEADLDGDGEYEPIAGREFDGSSFHGDLDSDGRPDIVVLDTKETAFHVAVEFRTIKSKEDVYVWKLKVKEKGNRTKMREYTGHVTILK